MSVIWENQRISFRASKSVFGEKRKGRGTVNVKSLTADLPRSSAYILFFRLLNYNFKTFFSKGEA